VHGHRRDRHQVVFKPFKGEIITGKVRTSTVDGLYVSLGFFEDVFIPAADLQAPSTFVHKEGLWMWSYETEGTEEGGT
jgi:DNA-directed RNA polymerase subunit E'/Rpb7